MAQTELVFVHLGNHLPSYVPHSISIAMRTSGLPCRLLASERHRIRVRVSKCTFTAIESFYDPSQFVPAASASLASSGFRQGFWQKSLERFFVLEQFMRANAVDRLVHAELDQLVFRCDVLLGKVEATSSAGILLPFHGESHALGSLVVVQKLDTLAKFVQYSKSGQLYWSEMELLARFANKNRDEISALPTAVNWLRQRPSEIPTVLTVPVIDTAGITDAAQLGQWVGGIDPKNVPITYTPQTKFVDPPSRYLLSQGELSSLTFRFSEESRELFVSSSGIDGEIRVYNLHLHSKIHKSLSRFSGGLGRFFQLSNNSKVLTFREARLSQLLDFFAGFFKVVFREPRYVAARAFSLIRRLAPLRPRLHGLWSLGTMTSNGVKFLNRFLKKQGLQVVYMSNLELAALASNVESFEGGSLAKTFIVDFSGSIPSTSQLKNLKKLASHSDVFSVSANGYIPPEVGRIPRGLPNLLFEPPAYPSLLRHAKRLSKSRDFCWSFEAKETNGTMEIAQFLHDSGRATNLRNMRKIDYLFELGQCLFHVFSPDQSLDEELVWETMAVGCVPVLSPGPISDFYIKEGFPVCVPPRIESLVHLSKLEAQERYLSLWSKTSQTLFNSEHWLGKLGLSSNVGRGRVIGS